MPVARCQPKLLVVVSVAVPSALLASIAVLPTTRKGKKDTLTYSLSLSLSYSLSLPGTAEPCEIPACHNCNAN